MIANEAPQNIFRYMARAIAASLEVSKKGRKIGRPLRAVLSGFAISCLNSDECDEFEDVGMRMAARSVERQHESTTRWYQGKGRDICPNVGPV